MTGKWQYQHRCRGFSGSPIWAWNSLYPYEVERYGRWHLRRILDVRPGITGYWQVEGRNNISFDEMVRLDLRYIRNCSLGMDVKILFKTVHVVLARRGVS